ncbi:MAG: DUF2218 domain-containing protein [Nocardioides sp.]|nr:DUF2218 domain-containing protein [Nocardioides sp.]
MSAEPSNDPSPAGQRHLPRSSVAQVRTSRADRYLGQLCDHLGHMQHDSQGREPGRHESRGHGPGGSHGSRSAVRGVERTGNHAEIDFDWGQCVLTASTDVLTIRVHAEDESALALGQELLTRRIATIGRRDQLTVTWQPTDPSCPSVRR